MLSQLEIDNSSDFTVIVSSEETLRKVLHGSNALAADAAAERRAKVRDIMKRRAKGTYSVSSESVAEAMLGWGHRVVT